MNFRFLGYPDKIFPDFIGKNHSVTEQISLVTE